MIKKVIAWLRSEPALVAAVVSAAIAYVSTNVYALSDTTVALIWAGVSVALGVAVRQQVSPTTK